jgi:hypothetical protein
MTLDELVSKWLDSQASEKSNSQPFLVDLCRALGVEAPDPSRGEADEDYVFERKVTLPHEKSATVGFIDLYKEGAFVLESKQGSTATSVKLGTAKRGTPMWTQAMQDARGQALGYARVLDKPVPFLIVCDVGYCFDLYACFDGSNSFRPFPTPLESRIFLRDLPARPDLVKRLRRIFEEPHSLDPSKQAIKVTREVAGYLANLAKSLEQRHPREAVARFLMRCLFTMFAEDVGLLPDKLFEQLLTRWLEKPEAFTAGLEALWEDMDEGKANPLVGKLLRFNGGLFKERTALPLSELELITLKQACICDWSQVEPAIFGTLVERALDPKERHSLGAHFTPRAYVERLVRPTLEEPLRDEWRAVRAEVRKLVEGDKNKKAAQKLKDFLHHLSTIRVLDPACGTGNFLYVSLDIMKVIESEARALLTSVDEGQQLGFGEGFSVTPQQFLGIELNPWSKEIAELVLWIGYLQWHFKTHGKVNPPEPVLRDYKNIECRDAVLEYDEKIARLGPDGKPLWRWDGETTKRSPVTGDDIPDESARIQTLTFVNPRKVRWPKADYIVSNPPFIGSRRMRQTLGDGYVEALRIANDGVSETVDFVMYWWNHAAELVRLGKVKRFGLITTNSITQVSSRKLVAKHLEAQKPLAILFAIPDHPWVDETNGASVRIAMTTGGPGRSRGHLRTVVSEGSADSDSALDVVLSDVLGNIQADLSAGAEVARARVLRANVKMSFQGPILVGEGFRLTPKELAEHGFSREAPPPVVRPYVIGRDIVQIPVERFVIDFFGMDSASARREFPSLFQTLLDRVKPHRDSNRDKLFRENWWLFGRPRPDMRSALKGIRRYIVTVETSKFKPFVFLPSSFCPDHKLYVIASDDALVLGTLSSRVHLAWAHVAGGTLEDRPTWTNTTCFLPFPFPTCTEAQAAAVRTLGEQLDGFRKARQAADPRLTLTGIYNVLEKLREGAELTEMDKHVHRKGLVGVLEKLHDDLDAAVFNAYGWPHDLTDEQIVERLVKLNAERAAEEKKGFVRWLRPDVQAPRTAAGKAAKKPVQTAMAGTEEDDEVAVPSGPQPWPKELGERMQAIRALLQRGRAMTAKEVARGFSGRSDAARVEATAEVLDALRVLGLVVAVEGSAEKKWAGTGRN